MVSDTERLLQASIDMIEKDRQIDALKEQVEQLQAENALLNAQVNVLALGRARAMVERLPNLLRPQV